MSDAYRHPELHFELEVPGGAELIEDMPDIALVLLDPEPGPASGFRANLAVTVEAVEAGTGPEAYTDAALRGQDRLLAAHRLIDREACDLRGGAGTRTLSHHVQGPLSITIEQWRLVAGDRAYTATASCATFDYAAVAGGFRAIAETLRAP